MSSSLSFHLIPLKQGLLLNLNLKLDVLARLTGQAAPEILLSPPSTLGLEIYMAFMWVGAGDLNSGPCVCRVSTLTHRSTPS